MPLLRTGLLFTSSAARRIRATGLLALSLACLAGVASAGVTTFTSRASFESSLPAGNFFSDFNGSTPTFASVPSFSGTGGTPSIGYTITAPAGGVAAFPDSGFTAIGNWGSSNNLIVTFNTGNVFSAGGDIWISDINGARQSGAVTVNFSDGSTVSVPSTTTGAFGFAGISLTPDSTPLSTMTVVGLGGGQYLNMTNFSVATAVPEPSSIALAVMGTAGLAAAVVRRRRRRR